MTPSMKAATAPGAVDTLRVSATRKQGSQDSELQSPLDSLHRSGEEDSHAQEMAMRAELRRHARGMRGATLAVEAGGVFTVPFVADLGAYLGAQISGPDTGNPALDTFAKASVGTTLGFSKGYALGRDRHGAYGGAGFLNLGYQSGNPILGRSLSVRWPGLGSLSLNERGYGITFHFPMGFHFPGGFKLEAAASLDVEHPALERVNQPLFRGIDYAIKRAQSDTEIVRRNLSGFASCLCISGPTHDQ